jgi:hypothetical protein
MPTIDNPADLISRGQTPREFLQPTIWKTGPEWLKQNEEKWPSWSPTPADEISEQKKTICLATNTTDQSILDRYSSWPKLIRVVPRCLRWRHKQNRATPLTVDEINLSHNKLVRLIQSTHFSSEIRTLQRDRVKEIGGSSKVLIPSSTRRGYCGSEEDSVTHRFRFIKNIPSFCRKLRYQSSLSNRSTKIITTPEHKARYTLLDNGIGLSMVVAKYGALLKGVYNVVEPSLPQ